MSGHVPTVVIGTDGSPDSERALHYGALEAARAGCGITLVHVTPDYVPIAAMYPVAMSEMEQQGRYILDQSAETLRRWAPDAPVQSLLRVGRRVGAVSEAGRGARMIVLGHRHASMMTRLSTGTTTTGVAARATAPVVSVPATWNPEVEHGLVIAGFKGAAHSGELLARAFAAASARKAKLVVMHAWRLPTAYDDVVEGRVHAEEWARAAHEEIDPLLEDWHRSYPDVEVEVRVLHDHPAHALREASKEADLMVLVRKSHGFPAAVHLGSVARTLLRDSVCPVAIVPPQAVAAETPGLVLEDEGTMQK
ncbi:universal stress protein [Nocardioides ferulae]|uniref:universal stress protein n=1 Tax=Nocardioides ferulae TaxID=2340821 RepID=UPI0013DE443C|nr:universal stress protein [Nocardioides ferulae]